MNNPKLHIETNCKIDISLSSDGEFSLISSPFEPDLFEHNEYTRKEGEDFVIKAFYKGSSNSYQSVSYDGDLNISSQVINFNSASNINIGDVVQTNSSEGCFQSVGGVSTSKEDLPTIYIRAPIHTRLSLEISGVGSFDSKKVDLGDTEIEASGSTFIYIGRICGEADIDLSGSSKAYVTVGGDVDIETSGTSYIEVWGSGDDLRVDSSGVSKVDLNYECLKFCKIDASGCSKITNSGRIGGKEKIKTSGSATTKGFD